MDSFFSIILMMLAGGGVGNDLLDFVPAEAYFKAAGIEMSVEALAEVLDAPVPEEVELQLGDSARRQLALRALGERKDVAALPIVQKHLASPDPLVADYAKAAQAALKGEEYERPVLSREKLRQDLACLPSSIGVIGRLSGADDGSRGDMMKKVQDLMANFRKSGGAREMNAEEMKEMEAEIMREMGRVISMLGNVRLSAITVGVASEFGGRQGYIVALARGLYNHEATGRLLGTAVDGVVFKAGGLAFYQVEHGHMYVAPVSDELFVFAMGASREEIPLAEVGKKVLAGGGDFAIGKDLAKLLDRADTTAPIWVLMDVSDAYRKIPFLAPFDTVSLQGRNGAGGKMGIRVEAKGSDAEATAEVVEEMNGGLTKAREELAKHAAENPPAAMFGEILKSVTITADGGSATMAGQLPEGGVMSILPLMYFSARPSIPGPDDPAPAPPKVEEAPARVAPE